MRQWVLYAVMLAGCGSVDGGSKIDAAIGDSTVDAPPDTAAPTCATSPSMMRVRYRAENNTNDHTGNFNGTPVGTNFSYTTGKYGMAFQLDGSDDVVTIADGDSLWPSGSLTVEAWVKTSATQAANIIVCKYACGGTCVNNASTAYFCLSTSASGQPVFEFRPDSSDTITGVTATLATVNNGAWHHLVGVRDAAAMTASLYVDGALATSAMPAAVQFGAMTNADNDVDLVTIGASIVGGQTSYQSWFAGAVDEVAIYHSALTASQVSAIYNAPDGKCL
jgi:hypothetical protein